MRMSFVALIAFIIGGSALANTNITWDEIRRDSDLHAAFPFVGFKYVSVSVDAVCVDGDNLRPFNPKHERCVAWDNHPENPACIATEVVTLSTPIRYTATECAEWDSNSENPSCVRYVSFEKVRPLNYNVEIFDAKSFSGEGGGLRLLFTKNYSIPACN